MLTAKAAAEAADARVRDVVRRVWGYDALRPPQSDAIRAALDRRDSLVVLPTGGGKSLCYQVPPLVDETTAVVVSPLISLMKDQVDGLREVGVPAVALHSGLSPDERRAAEREIAAGRVRLIFAAPERLLLPGMLSLMRQARVHSFAIDEAHCISHWGHDFRPEYRRLRELRDAFPLAALHAFTATATERVRDDIARQLDLRDPVVLVGSFDRPNLIFRVVPREDEYRQVRETLDRRKGEASIIYCISRKDTESLAASLQADTFSAAAYHAGMSPEARRRTQDAFAEERLDIVVATVAFGMGIDRSNVRCVIHTAMPKSIEHYQQEAGRAGRDGLPAECVLLYSSGDMFRWQGLMNRASEDGSPPPRDATDAAAELLGHMRAFCSVPACRHRALSEYFGQAYEKSDCGACDVCLGETEVGEDERVLAQKVISCVARVKERFGAGHVVDVLTGANTTRMQQLGHNHLSTYGLLREMTKQRVLSLVNQLVDQGLLARVPVDGGAPNMHTIGLNSDSWEVLRGKRAVYFQKVREEVAETQADIDSWEGVDRPLFEALRAVRRAIAEEHGVAPFVIMHDTTLRSLARVRPTTLPALSRVRGLGEKRVRDYGLRLLEAIERAVHERNLLSDQPDLPNGPRAAAAPRAKKTSASEVRAAALFEQGMSVEDVCEQMGRAQSTVYGYLERFIEQKRPQRIDTWVDAPTYDRVAAARDALGEGSLKPLFDHLNAEVPYELIRVVLAHQRVSRA